MSAFGGKADMASCTACGQYPDPDWPAIPKSRTAALDASIVGCLLRRCSLWLWRRPATPSSGA